MDHSPSTVQPLTDTEQRAWFGLLAVLALGMPQVERTVREHGLVYIEYLLLAELATAPAGLPLGELAGCVQASQSRLSHRLRKVVKLGYVELHPSSSDGRVSIAQITARGRNVVDEITPATLRDIRQLVFDHLEPSQVDALADALTTVSQHLKNSGSTP
jgi:DNA-binding MarR family transcriptional regulator